jgi:hypothetical protein
MSLAASAAGCSTAHYTVNDPLIETRLNTGHTARNPAASDNRMADMPTCMLPEES